jgi:hypothetical protein
VVRVVACGVFKVTGGRSRSEHGLSWLCLMYVALGLMGSMMCRKCVTVIGDVVFVVFALLATFFNRGKTRA